MLLLLLIKNQIGLGRTHHSKNQKLDWIIEDGVDVQSELKDGLTRIKDIVQAFRDFSDIDQIAAVYPYDLNEGIVNTLKSLGV